MLCPSLGEKGRDGVGQISSQIDFSIIEGTTEAELEPEAVRQALRLLARWAARRARKQGIGERGDVGSLVTPLYSNDYTLKAG